MDPVHGSDAGAATESAPLATLEAGLQRVRVLRAQANSTAELILRGGTHFLSKADQPLTLGPDDSNLIIRGYGNGEKAIISGGAPLYLHWEKAKTRLALPGRQLSLKGSERLHAYISWT